MTVPARRIIPGALEAPGADIRHSERACDADRSRYINYLSQCHQAGYIETGVFTARMEAAAECVTADQLVTLLADLPPMVPRRARALDRMRGFGRTTLGRRWLHIAGGAGALCWAFIAPVLIYTSTGYLVTYGQGSDVWVQTEHPGPALAMLWFFIITGVAALFADIAWWIHWETE